LARAFAVKPAAPHGGAPPTGVGAWPLRAARANGVRANAAAKGTAAAAKAPGVFSLPAGWVRGGRVGGRYSLRRRYRGDHPGGRVRRRLCRARPRRHSGRLAAGFESRPCRLPSRRPPPRPRRHPRAGQAYSHHSRHRCGRYRRKCGERASRRFPAGRRLARAGGNWPIYNPTRARGVVNQQKLGVYACGAACSQKVLSDRGTKIAAEVFGTDPQRTQSVVRQLNEHLPG
jgi:hypothetical protein